MPRSFFKQHHHWEDWAVMGLGIAIGLTPWLTEQPVGRTVMLNAALTGVLILMLAQLELVDLRRWQEVAITTSGAWIAAAPLVLDYSGQDRLAISHATLGGLVALLGTFELWQDWRRSDRELSDDAQTD